MTDLDLLLAIQLTIAWAGEGRCVPKRMGWWETDLIDPSGGGDFMARLAPRTHQWASLEAVREAARRVDERARGKMADPDSMRTPFFLGFDLDEKLSDHLAALKRSGRPPGELLPLPVDLGTDFSKDALATMLTAQGTEAFTVVPGGRQLRGPMPEDGALVVRRLAAALVPLTDAYPLPFFKVGR